MDKLPLVHTCEHTNKIIGKDSELTTPLLKYDLDSLDFNEPYHFTCGEVTVHLKFNIDGKPLANCLITYFKQLKTL